MQFHVRFSVLLPLLFFMSLCHDNMVFVSAQWNGINCQNNNSWWEHEMRQTCALNKLNLESNLIFRLAMRNIKATTTAATINEWRMEKTKNFSLFFFSHEIARNDDDNKTRQVNCFYSSCLLLNEEAAEIVGDPKTKKKNFSFCFCFVRIGNFASFSGCLFQISSRLTEFWGMNRDRIFRRRPQQNDAVTLTNNWNFSLFASSLIARSLTATSILLFASLFCFPLITFRRHVCIRVTIASSNTEQQRKSRRKHCDFVRRQTLVHGFAAWNNRLT